MGAIAPGFEANLVILDGDLRNLAVRETWLAGQRAGRLGRYLAEERDVSLDSSFTHSVNIRPVRLSDLQISPEEGTRAVELVPDQSVTRVVEINPPVRGGYVVADPNRYVVKLACVERHHATGHVGVGLLSGLGLKRGAIAGSIGHDAHNVMTAGVDDVDLLVPIATVAERQGGLAVVADAEARTALPLPVGGLMSSQPLE